MPVVSDLTSGTSEGAEISDGVGDALSHTNRHKAKGLFGSEDLGLFLLAFLLIGKMFNE